MKKRITSYIHLAIFENYLQYQQKPSDDHKAVPKASSPVELKVIA